MKEKRKKLRNNATPQEIMLWVHLKSRNLGYKFQRRHSLENYIVDFYCREKKLIIEIDGIQHDDQSDKIYDEKRTKYFESLGYDVLRFWNNEINTNIGGVLQKIKDFLNTD